MARNGCIDRGAGESFFTDYTDLFRHLANPLDLAGSPRAGIKLGEDNYKEANRIF